MFGLAGGTLVTGACALVDLFAGMITLVKVLRGSQNRFGLFISACITLIGVLYVLFTASFVIWRNKTCERSY